MKRGLLITVVTLFAVQLTGCSTTIAGQAMKAQPSPIERAMPTLPELGQAVGGAVQVTSPIQVGGIEVLRGDPENISPAECAALIHAGIRYVYQHVPAGAVARGIWESPKNARGARSVSVSIAVIDVDTPDDASAWYRDAAPRWQSCQGSTVTQPMDAITFSDKVVQAASADGFLTANVVVSTTDGIITPVPLQRAVTTASHYLVDVDVLGATAAANTASNADTAVAVARLVAGKLTSAG